MTFKVTFSLDRHMVHYFLEIARFCIGKKVAPQLALSPAMITALPLTIVDKSLAIAVTVV